MRIALAGNPNCGKTALFNAITGSRQKVGNYPGVTVERKEGFVLTQSGLKITLVDLPGAYSLDARTPDEMIARDVLLGRLKGEDCPRALVAVADATNLERNLGLVLELKALGMPVILAMNMMDLAKRRGLELDLQTLSRELGVPVVPTVAVRGEGIKELLQEVEDCLQVSGAQVVSDVPRRDWNKPTADEVRARFAEVDRILRQATRKAASPNVWTDRIDRIVVHPVWGTLLLLSLLALMFQAIFAWAGPAQDAVEAGVAWIGEGVGNFLADGPLKSLLVDGIIAGVGSVLVFLPQILLLFLFILILEDSGYMARAAFLMDRLMGGVGLNGRAFIPLLSSYACAIPGIMATRTIENRHDRITTILIAPLTTCSARLPVYTLLIAAFIPTPLQGWVMFGLYAVGILGALAVAWVLRKFVFRASKPPLLMELPSYKVPSVRNVMMGLWERARLFIRRAGTVILALSILVWFLASYPKPPAEVAGTEGVTPIHYSYAGKLGHAIEPVLRPLGFDWRIGIALVPGFAAREVMVGALATVYAVEASAEGGDEAVEGALAPILARDWSLATALSLLVWYVFACQCLSTLAVTRRETNSWFWPAVMLLYTSGLAYGASFVTYHLARWAGLG